MNSSSVSVAKIAELLDLKNFTDEIDLKSVRLQRPILTVRRCSLPDILSISRSLVSRLSEM